MLAILAVWHATFQGPFVFDDLESIVANSSIRHLWPLTEALAPPANGTGVTGRPLINLSLALNYAISGYDPWSYHALNLLIHMVASLALFGLVRRTLLLPALRPRFGPEAPMLSLLVAALWALHPLQTDAVTFVVQRTESLMGCFFLLTFYALARHDEPGANRRGWLAGSVIICLLGMTTKEVMITAPPLLLLYDRTFLAGSFREAWRQRRGYYLALASTWIPLGVLVATNGATRGVAAGFGLGVTSWEYLLTQCRAIVLYLQLALWPHPLILDYGGAVAHRLGEVWAQAIVIVALLAGTTVALWRRPALGFFGAWFFVILAPSSSVVPLVSQTIAEHRMYLPLAAVVAAAAVGVSTLLGRASLLLGLSCVGALGVVAMARNADYRDPISLWRDAIAKVPTNPRAHYNLAGLLANQPARQADAIAQLETALRLKPNFAEAHYSLATLLAGQPGRQADAIAHYEAALRLKPEHAEEGYNNLANYLAGLPGRQVEALAHYEAALRLKPDYVEAHYNLANFLADLPGRQADAIAHYETALRLKPDYVEAHYNLALLLADQPGRQVDTIAHLETALRLKPDYVEAHNNLAALLADQPGRLAEAIAHLETALRLKPDYVEAHNNLAALLADQPGRLAEAIAHYETAVRLLPTNAIIHFNLAKQLEKLPNRRREAVSHYMAALSIDPNFTEAREALLRLQPTGR